MSYIVEPHTAATSLSPTRAPDLYHVRSHLAAAVVCTLGDVEGARHASRIAKRLCWASAAVTICFLLVIVVGAGGYSNIH